MARASSHRQGAAPTALQAALSSGGVLGPTRGEGRALGRAITRGDQKGKNRCMGGAADRRRQEVGDGD
jgi:hypothetical protein